MTSSDLIKLAHLRLEEAEILLKRRKYAGAYYIVGYSVECALKACIAKKTKRFEFPDLARIETLKKSYTHNLEKLLEYSGLDKEMEDQVKSGSPVGRNWAIVVLWNSQSRYKASMGRVVAKDMVLAASDQVSGVVKWLESKC